MELKKNYPWIDTIPISEDAINRWKNVGSHQSLTFWALKNLIIDKREYFKWAVNHYKMPLVKDMFFQQHLIKKKEWSQVKNAYDWDEEILPICFQNNTIFVGCVEPPPESEKIIGFNSRFILANYKSLEINWKFFQALTNSITNSINENTRSVFVRVQKENKAGPPLHHSLRPAVISNKEELLKTVTLKEAPTVNQTEELKVKLAKVNKTAPLKPAVAQPQGTFQTDIPTEKPDKPFVQRPVQSVNNLSPSVKKQLATQDNAKELAGPQGPKKPELSLAQALEAQKIPSSKPSSPVASGVAGQKAPIKSKTKTISLQSLQEQYASKPLKDRATKTADLRRPKTNTISLQSLQEEYASKSSKNSASAGVVKPADLRRPKTKTISLQSLQETSSAKPQAENKPVSKEPQPASVPKNLPNTGKNKLNLVSEIKNQSTLPENEEGRFNEVDSTFPGRSPGEQEASPLSVMKSPTKSQVKEPSGDKEILEDGDLNKAGDSELTSGGESTHFSVILETSYERLWKYTKQYYCSSMVFGVKDNKAYLSNWAGRVTPSTKDEKFCIDLEAYSLFKIVQKDLTYNGFVVDSPLNKKFFNYIGWSNYPKHVTAIPIKNKENKLVKIFTGLSVDALSRQQLQEIERHVLDFFQAEDQSLKKAS